MQAGQKEQSCALISARVSGKKWHCFEIELNKQTSPSWQKKIDEFMNGFPQSNYPPVWNNVCGFALLR